MFQDRWIGDVKNAKTSRSFRNAVKKFSPEKQYSLWLLGTLANSFTFLKFDRTYPKMRPLVDNIIAETELQSAQLSAYSVTYAS